MRLVFSDLDKNIMVEKFQVGLFDKVDSFPLSILRMPDKSSNVPCNIVHFSVSVESFKLLVQTAILTHSQQQFNHFLPVWTGKSFPLEK